MRVLFATTNFPPQTGGPSRQSLEIVQELRARGHEVIVCLPRGLEVDPSASDGVFKLGHGTSVTGRMGRWIGDWREVRQLMRDFRPDILHFQVFGGVLCLLFGIAARLEGVPSIVKLTGERSFESSVEAAAESAGWRGAVRARLKFLFHSLLDALILKTFTQVWATSPEFERRLASRRLSPASIVMIPNFIDLHPFTIVAEARKVTVPGRRVRILTLCRFRPWKGLSTIVQTAAFLKSMELDFEWRVHGDGPETYRGELVAQATAAGVADRLQFCAPVSPTDVAQAYAQADLFVLLSDYEPFGIVLVEAMASGVPVVSTSVGGMPFVMGQVLANNVVPPGNGQAAAQAIHRLATVPERYQFAVRNGRQRAEEFGLQSGVGNLEQAYRILIQ